MSLPSSMADFVPSDCNVIVSCKRPIECGKRIKSSLSTIADYQVNQSKCKLSHVASVQRGKTPLNKLQSDLLLHLS